MKKSNGKIERVKISVPEQQKGMWTIPNFSGNWDCKIVKIDGGWWGSINLWCLNVKKDVSTSVDMSCIKNETNTNEVSVSLNSNNYVKIECEI